MPLKAILVNPGFPSTFWSFESVLKLAGKKGVLPPLGLLTLAAILPDDWELKIIDLTFQEISSHDWKECDLVMVTGMSVQRPGILETIREGKRRGKTVVVGGAWAFHFPEEALQEGADLVVIGEAEVAVDRLLDHLENNDSGVIIRQDRMADLTNSPPPRYDLVDMDQYLNVSLQFSRGCPFHCEFCDVTLMLGRTVRTKTPDQILRELQMLYDLGGRRLIFFVDDNFIGNPVRAKKLLREMDPWLESNGRPFDFYTQASVNMAADPELLKLMAQAGFFKVFLGIETLDEESLKGVKKFQNVAVDLAQACKRINEAGIGIIAGCIIGFDNEESGADRRLIEFAAETNIPEMFGTLLQAGPGTGLWNRLERENRLLSIDDEHFSTQTALINFIPTRPVEQIVREFVHFYDVLYDREAYLERAYKHVVSMNPPRLKKRFSLPQLYELRILLSVLFKQGIVYPTRAKFLRYFLTLLWKTPHKLVRFIDYCLGGEHYYGFRQTVREELLNKDIGDFYRQHESPVTKSDRSNRSETDMDAVSGQRSGH
jgi:radical SAM superfamily enzyme YgiQ (UPF0313 family)